MYKYLLLLNDFIDVIDTKSKLSVVTWFSGLANKVVVAFKNFISYIRYFINNILVIDDALARTDSMIKTAIRSNVIQVDALDSDSIALPLNQFFGMIRYVVGDVIYIEMYSILIIGEAFLLFQIIRRIIDIIDYLKSTILKNDLLSNDVLKLKKYFHFIGS